MLVFPGCFVLETESVKATGDGHLITPPMSNIMENLQNDDNTIILYVLYKTGSLARARYVPRLIVCEDGRVLRGRSVQEVTGEKEYLISNDNMEYFLDKLTPEKATELVEKIHAFFGGGEEGGEWMYNVPIDGTYWVLHWRVGNKDYEILASGLHYEVELKHSVYEWCKSVATETTMKGEVIVDRFDMSILNEDGKIFIQCSIPLIL